MRPAGRRAFPPRSGRGSTRPARRASGGCGRAPGRPSSSGAPPLGRRPARRAFPKFHAHAPRCSEGRALGVDLVGRKVGDGRLLARGRVSDQGSHLGSGERDRLRAQGFRPSRFGLRHPRTSGLDPMGPPAPQGSALGPTGQAAVGGRAHITPPPPPPCRRDCIGPGQGRQARAPLTFGEKFGQGVVELGGILFGGGRSDGRGSAFGADRAIHGRDL